VAAAKRKAGELREDDVLDYRANGWVVELHRDDVVLARVLWWREKARGELSTTRPKTATAALVGGEVLVEIGRQQRVVEHEQATGKLARGWIRAEETWCWLSTGMPCAARAREDGGGGMWFGRSELTRELEEQDVEVRVMLLRARDRELRRRGGLSTATRRWRPAEARGNHGARAGGHQGRGIGPGEEEGDTWKRSQLEVALRRR
jgi:hypothetical protein